MIISFSFENWMSFRDETSFSMVASREMQHGNRVPRVRKYRTKILPIASIYGGNASGKSNFFKALEFVHDLVIEGTKVDSPIPVEPYRLDRASTEKPSRFKLELLIDEIIYEFSFAVTRKAVVEEKLVKITSTSEKILYNRQEGTIDFDSSLDEDERLRFVFEGTRDNQLFLTNSVSQNVNHFRLVHDWFEDELVLVSPGTRFGGFGRLTDKGDLSYDRKGEILKQLDTGIARLGTERIPLEDIPPLGDLKHTLQENLKEGMGVDFPLPIHNRLIIGKESGELVVKKLVTFHSGSDGTEVKFDVSQESDGTQRVMNLLPAFFGVSSSSSKKVYVIDELDRSLHSLLTRQLIEGYLETCSPESRAQLLITTHDLLLINQNLFRRDEIWIAERYKEGNSELRSFSDYKDVRYDKDILKSYLRGRMGGIPNLSFSSFLTDKEEERMDQREDG